MYGLPKSVCVVPVITVIVVDVYGWIVILVHLYLCCACAGQSSIRYQQI